MARKEKIIEIQDREQLLKFKIREMSAVQLERWMLRAVILISKANPELPENADIAKAGEFILQNWTSLIGNLDPDKTEIMLDEMLGCCSRVIDKIEEKCTPESVDAYIMDVKTLFNLRLEAVKLNLGFFAQGAESL